MRKLCEYLIVVGGVRLLQALPRPIALRLGEGLGRLAFALYRPRRAVALRNLALAFPEWPAPERQRVAAASFAHLGRMVAEVCHFPRLAQAGLRGIVSYEGLEHYLAARARGRGVILMTGHFGAWELSAFAHARNGHPSTVVVRALANRRVDALVNRLRGLSGNRLIERKQALRKLLAGLRQGESVAALIDQNVAAREGVFVEFFGRPACTTPGLAALARLSGAPVLPSFLVTDRATDTYRLIFEPEVELARTGDPEADDRTNTARFIGVLEAYVRKEPELYFWAHRRWKTRPAGEPPIY